MRYLGGKYRIRSKISSALEQMRYGRDYLEPFVGGANVLQEMSGKRVASDSNKALITMYKELQKGWIPPTSVSEDMYKMYKNKKDEDDPNTAFIGFCCTFGAKWFDGYARSVGCYRNFALNGHNSLMKTLPKIQDVEFHHSDYRELNPVDKLIYCDPPYRGKTEYKDKFDSDEFWRVMRFWSKKNIVVISEYESPEDFKCILEINTKTSIRDANNKCIKTVEKLFLLK